MVVGIVVVGIVVVGAIVDGGLVVNVGITVDGVVAENGIINEEFIYVLCEPRAPVAQSVAMRAVNQGVVSSSHSSADILADVRQ